MYVVTGATGNVGSAAVRKLLAAGAPVTAVVRNEAKAEPLEKLGAKIAIADLADAVALAKIMIGAKGAFLMTPPESSSDDYLGDRRKIAESLTRAAWEGRVGVSVYLSTVGAQWPSGTGPIQTGYVAEQMMRDRLDNAIFLRPCYFLDNWLQSVPVAREQGVLPGFLRSGVAIPMIATPDIGAAAAEALLGGAKGIEVRNLAGPKDYAPEEIAEAIGAALGREVKYHFLPIESARATFESFGLTPSFAALYQEMFEAADAGKLVYEGTPRRMPTTAREFFAQALG
jgi:uncharacterized protein YbjT (DUF2867 family)